MESIHRRVIALYSYRKLTLDSVYEYVYSYYKYEYFNIYLQKNLIQLKCTV